MKLNLLLDTDPGFYRKQINVFLFPNDSDLVDFSGLGGRAACHLQWPFLLTWFNFNPSMDN